MFFSSLFFLVLHLFSTLKVDSSLIFSAFLSRKVCIWRCNWKNGCDAERKAEKNEEKSLAYLHSSTKELFQWYHHHSGWLSVIHFYASSLRKLLKVASAHRITEKIRHTQAPPTPASAAFSNDVLVKRKPLGPPLCLFFSLQKPIKAKELRKLFMSIKNWQLSLMPTPKQSFSPPFLQRSPCWSQSHKKVPSFLSGLL